MFGIPLPKSHTILLLVLLSFLVGSDSFVFIRPNARTPSVTGWGSIESRNQKVDKSISVLSAYPPRKNRRGNKNDNNNEGDNEDDDFDPIMDEPKKRGDGRNWIEKSSPTGIGSLNSSKEEDTDEGTDGNYDLAINGESFQTGPLSLRMYETLMAVALKRFPEGTTTLPSELEDVYKLYAMDITAKEAIKAALEQNGMQMVIEDGGSEEDEGMWGDVDSVQLIDMETGEVEGGNEMYETFDDAVEQGDWEPGQSFNFIMRNVPAKLQEMDISDLLSSLDPKGEYRKEANDKGITMPDEDVQSLRDLGKECERRGRVAPFETDSIYDVFKGDSSKGYNAMKRSDLLQESGNVDGSESTPTLMHVMDSLVSHGCLLVDVTDGGASYLGAHKLTKMWDLTNKFFQTLEDDDEANDSLPKMKTAEGAGSPHATVGFMVGGEGSMKFLETRSERDESGTSKLIPSEASKIIGEDGVKEMIDSFDLMCNIGKDVVRVAVAAANMEYDAFLGQGKVESFEETSDLPFISGLTFEEAEISGIVDEDSDDDYVAAAKMSSEAAAVLAEDLIDDGQYRETSADQGSVNMSPHRLCRYVDTGKKEKSADQSETFGAHTDTSFVTIVPVAATSGLEVFDEGASRWFRPELLARNKWEEERENRGLDPSVQFESVTVEEDGEDKEVNVPWHSRYVCVMPGELLQVCTRNEVPAALHRVVSASGDEARISAPVLLRARSGYTFDLKKYFGNEEVAGPLLNECNGMKMEDIHNSLQPSSYR